MMEASYRVLDFNSSTNTVTVARADYWDSNSPDRYVTTTLDTSLFSYNTTDYTDLIIYYNCPYLIAGFNYFNCTHIICYFTTLDLDEGALRSPVCGEKVTIPIFQSAATSIVSDVVTFTRLREVLKNGLGL